MEPQNQKTSRQYHEKNIPCRLSAIENGNLLVSSLSEAILEFDGILLWFRMEIARVLLASDEVFDGYIEVQLSNTLRNFFMKRKYLISYLGGQK